VGTGSREHETKLDRGMDVSYRYVLAAIAQPPIRSDRIKHWVDVDQQSIRQVILEHVIDPDHSLVQLPQPDVENHYVDRCHESYPQVAKSPAARHSDTVTPYFIVKFDL
jgi:hypothetical protein